jgi:hypothetical protein
MRILQIPQRGDFEQPLPDVLQAVHGLDAEKINQVLDSYRDGSRVSPVGSP